MSSTTSAKIRYIPLSYDCKSSKETALRLVEALKGRSGSTATFRHFTDGITNTLIKAETRVSATQSQDEVDRDAVLLRAYGPGTDVLIDREREIHAHTQLAAHGLASRLLARFDNGLLYEFVPGDVCAAEDMRKPEVYRKVAAKMGQWHGALSLDAICTREALVGDDAPITPITGNSRPKPNLWTVLESWLKALPHATEQEQRRQQTLRDEFVWLQDRLASTEGLGSRDFVFGHCDLLCGNIILQRRAPLDGPAGKGLNGCQSADVPDHNDEKIEDVSFIDYEYATAAPAAFDIANHFSEWGGLECDYSALPSRSQRTEFLSYYVESFFRHSGIVSSEAERATALARLESQIDLYRGAPGFYWGTWALIQAQISPIDFDYAAYADKRLAEYHAWKAAETRTDAGKEQTPRERRWTQA